MSKIKETSVFKIEYEFNDVAHETEIAMLVNGDNILEFEREGVVLTTKWNLDDIAEWLRKFLDTLSEDPYPIAVEGEFAAIKDVNAREFDTDDEEEFDEYYDKLDDWCIRHRWHPACSGAIIADLYFQLVGDIIEISWDNQDPEEGVKFTHLLGGIRVPKSVFVVEVNNFLNEYADHWFG